MQNIDRREDDAALDAEEHEAPLDISMERIAGRAREKAAAGKPLTPIEQFIVDGDEDHGQLRRAPRELRPTRTTPVRRCEVRHRRQRQPGRRCRPTRAGPSDDSGDGEPGEARHDSCSGRWSR